MAKKPPKSGKVSSRQRRTSGAGAGKRSTAGKAKAAKKAASRKATKRTAAKARKVAAKKTARKRAAVRKATTAKAKAARKSAKPAGTRRAGAGAAKGKGGARTQAARKTTSAKKPAARKRGGSAQPGGAAPQRPAAPPPPTPKTSPFTGTLSLASLQAEEAVPDEAPLTPEEIAEFRQMLLEKREEVLRDLRRLEDEALGRNRNAIGGRDQGKPIHMADIGSENWEQEFTLGLVENERALLREIDEALERIEKNTYGICVATKKQISRARLRAKPWAKYCIEYARKLERGTAR